MCSLNVKSVENLWQHFWFKFLYQIFNAHLRLFPFDFYCLVLHSELNHSQVMFWRHSYSLLSNKSQRAWLVRVCRLYKKTFFSGILSVFLLVRRIMFLGCSGIGCNRNLYQRQSLLTFLKAPTSLIVCPECVPACRVANVFERE